MSLKDTDVVTHQNGVEPTQNPKSYQGLCRTYTWFYVISEKHTRSVYLPTCFDPKYEACLPHC